MDTDIGTATIRYETPEGHTEERVDNERIAFVDDHWVVWEESEEGDGGTVRRIPRDRVYAVERDVEELESTVQSLLDEAASRLG
ncbi:hypothetical protein [Halomarina litorea]|uniref:hypothetical protein n=1 Tax=Halomarina litorea TaxID=2961595 RepID=UPI0020C48E0F|nr:hypothetical protein [Halomarina sp. BCD28]